MTQPFLISVLTFAAYAAHLLPPQHPSMEVFTFQLHGSQEFLFQPPLLDSHVEVNMQLLSGRPLKPVIVKLRRDSQQEAAEREISTQERLDFILRPQRNYSLLVESEEGAVIQVSLTPYFKQSEKRLASKSKFVLLRGKLAEFQTRLTRLLEEPGTVPTTSHGAVYKLLLALLKLSEAIAILALLLQQIRQIKKQVSSSRHLI